MTSSLKTAAVVPAVAELGLVPQWVLWRYETRETKSTKVPYAAPGRKAAVDNPQSWLPYDRAVAAAAGFDGLGFVFTGTVYCGHRRGPLHRRGRRGGGVGARHPAAVQFVHRAQPVGARPAYLDSGAAPG
jgi:hypothetical protein